MRNKNGIALLLALALCISLAPPVPAAADPAAGDVITISSVDELLALSRQCTLDAWSRGKTVLLDADLSLASVDYLPIPTFSGAFDGGGHTISGLDLSGKVSPAGFIGVLQEGAVLKNLNVSGSVSPSGESEYVGGLAGVNRGLIQSCTFSGTINGKDSVGGICGYNEVNGKIEDCSVSGGVTGSSMTGGVAGENEGVISGCINHSYVNITNVDPGLNLSEIELSANLLTLRSADTVNIATDTGGVAGYSSGMLLSCANEGIVGCQHIGYNVGGVVGRSCGFVSGCVNRGQVFGRKDVGGVAGQAEPDVKLNLSADKISTLRGQLDELERLVDQAAGDAEGISGDVSGKFDALNDCLDAASDNLNALSDRVGDYGDTTINEINRGSDILDDAIDRLNTASDDAEGLSDEITDAVSALETASRELSKSGDYTGGIASSLGKSADELAKAGKDLARGIDKIKAGLDELSQAVIVKDQAGAQEALQQISEGLKELGTALSDIGKALGAKDGGETASLDTGGASIQDILDGSFPDLFPIQPDSGSGSGLANSILAAGSAVEAIGNGMYSLNQDVTIDLSVLKPGFEEISNGMGDLSKASSELSRAAEDAGKSIDAAKPFSNQLQKGMDSLAEALDQIEHASKHSKPVLDEMQSLVQFLNGVDPIQFIEPDSYIGSAADDLFDSLTLLGDRLDDLNSVGSNSADRLSEDVRAINRQFGEVMDTLLDAADTVANGRGDVFTDVSEADVDAVTSGKLRACVNEGEVNGDVCVGGVAGTVGVEHELDPEDDALSSDVPAYRRAYEMKAILQGCVNKGTVRSRRDWAGGICGRLSLGLAIGCEGYGRVESEGGSYLGGIAGFASGTVRDCWAKCTLSGGKYIGGIVGAAGLAGDPDGGVVQGCRAYVHVEDSTQYAGAISGVDRGSFKDNLFVSDDLAGIGRASLSGEAEPVSYEALLGMDAPEAFHTLTLRFLADDKVLKEYSFQYGDTLDNSVFPVIPAKEGNFAHWDRSDLRFLNFDLDVTAEYTPYITALSSDETRSDKRPVFFVEGRFTDEDSLTARPLENDFLPSDTPMVLRYTLEQWQVSIPSGDASLHTLRYLSPNGSPDNLEIYVFEDAGWRRLDTESVGSYLVFDVSGPQAAVAVVAREAIWWIWALILASLATAAIVLVLLLKRLKRRIKKEKPEHDPKRKRRIILLILWIILGLALIAWIWLSASGLLDDAAAARILYRYASQDEFAFELAAKADIGNRRLSVDADFTRFQVDGAGVTAIGQFGTTLYSCDGMVYLENGRGVTLEGVSLPDAGALLEAAKVLYQDGKLSVFRSGNDVIYSTEANNKSADNFLRILFPGVSELASFDGLTVEMSARSGALKDLRITASGASQDGASLSLNALLTARDTWEPPLLPEPVSNAIRSGGGAEAENLLPLLKAWGTLNLTDPLAARLTLCADCGPLVLDDNLELFRTWADGKQAVCARKAGRSLYFSGDNIYDEEGTVLLSEDAGDLGSQAKLLELVHALSMQGTASCTGQDGGSLYTLRLDAEALSKAAGTILPASEGLDIDYTEGVLEISVREDAIERVRLSCGGTLQLLFTEAPVSLSCELEVEQKSFTLPTAVADAIARAE